MCKNKPPLVHPAKQSEMQAPTRKNTTTQATGSMAQHSSQLSASPAPRPWRHGAIVSLLCLLQLRLASADCPQRDFDRPTQCWLRGSASCVVSVRRWPDLLDGDFPSPFEKDIFTSEDCGGDWWAPQPPLDYDLRTDWDRNGTIHLEKIARTVWSPTVGKMEPALYRAISQVAAACTMGLMRLQCNRAVGAPPDPTLHATPLRFEDALPFMYGLPHDGWQMSIGAPPVGVDSATVTSKCTGHRCLHVIPVDNAGCAPQPSHEAALQACKQHFGQSAKMAKILTEHDRDYMAHVADSLAGFCSGTQPTTMVYVDGINANADPDPDQWRYSDGDLIPSWLWGSGFPVDELEKGCVVLAVDAHDRKDYKIWYLENVFCSNTSSPYAACETEATTGFTVEAVCCRTFDTERPAEGKAKETAPAVGHLTELFNAAIVLGKVKPKSDKNFLCGLDEDTGVTVVRINVDTAALNSDPTLRDCRATQLVAKIERADATMGVMQSTHPSLFCQRRMISFERQFINSTWASRFSLGPGYNASVELPFACFGVDELEVARGAAAHKASMAAVVRGVGCSPDTDTCLQHMRVNFKTHHGIIGTLGGCGSVNGTESINIFSAHGSVTLLTHTYKPPFGPSDPNPTEMFRPIAKDSIWTHYIMPNYSAAFNAPLPDAKKAELTSDANAVHRGKYMVPTNGSESTVMIPTGCQGPMCNTPGAVLCGYKHTAHSILAVFCPQAACIRWLDADGQEPQIGCTSDFYRALTKRNVTGNATEQPRLDDYFIRCVVLDDVRAATATVIGDELVVRVQCCGAPMCLQKMERMAPALQHITLCASKWIMFGQAPIHRLGTTQSDYRPMVAQPHGRFAYSPMFDPLKYTISTDRRAAGRCGQILLRVPVAKRLPNLWGGAPKRTVAHGATIVPWRYLILHTAHTRAAQLMHAGDVLRHGAIPYRCFQLHKRDENPWLFHAIAPSNMKNVTAVFVKWEDVAFHKGWVNTLKCMFDRPAGTQSDKWRSAQRARRNSLRLMIVVLLGSGAALAVCGVSSVVMFPVLPVSESNVDNTDWLQVDDEYERWKRLRGKFVRRLKRRQGLQVSWSESASSSNQSASTESELSSDEGDSLLCAAAFGPLRPAAAPLSRRTIYRVVVRTLRMPLNTKAASRRPGRRFAGGLCSVLWLGTIRFYGWLYASFDRIPYTGLMGVAPMPPEVKVRKRAKEL